MQVMPNWKQKEFIMKHLTKLIGILSVLLANSLAAQETQNTMAADPAVADTTVHPAGMRLEWTYFIGGNTFETVKTRTPVLDRNDMLWFLGETASKDFPTTPDAFCSTYLGGSDMGKEDIYLIKFNTRQPGIAYSTILGGAKGPETPSDLVMNTNGTITIVGSTSFPDFPTTADALTKQFQGPGYGRHDDGFLTILGDYGRTLKYSTFIGGTGGDRVTKVFIDPSGEMTLFGTTESPGFPTADAIRPAGVRDGSLFVMRLDAKGQRMLSSRLLANFAPFEPDVQRLASGDFLITASTNNPAFQTTPGAFSSTYHGSSMQKMPDGNMWPGPGDIFIMRLSADMKTISFATLFGGTGDEYYPKIAIVPGGDFFITGSTSSKDLPVTADAIEKTMESKKAIFLARFSGDGRHLKYCTYLGGKGAEATSYAGGLVYDGRSKVYLGVGQVTSPTYPVTPDALQAKHQGEQDAVLLAFNVADNSLAYCSYLGGSKNEDMPILTFDANGGLYVIGTTNSDDFPTLEKTLGQRKEMDVYISKFSFSPALSNSVKKLSSSKLD
jgi:hypothetical protein